jgi:hypothetical protein
MIYDVLLGQTAETIRWLSELPDSYFIAASLVPLAFALIARDLLSFLRALLFGLVVVALIATRDHLSLIVMAFAIAVSLLLVLSRVAESRRHRAMLETLADLQQRLAALESAAEIQFMRSLRGAGSPSPAATHAIEREASKPGE